MSITISSKRPGVFSDYTVSSIYRGESSHAAALVCEVTQETSQVATLLSSEEARRNFPAEDTLCACCDILFANGVGKIYLSPVAAAASDPAQAFADALAKLEEYEDLYCVICDSTDTAVLAALKSHVEDCSKARLERLGFAGLDSMDVLQSTAQAVNSERICLAVPAAKVQEGGDARGIYTACGYAALCATADDPAASFHNAPVAGISGLAQRLSEDQIDLCIESGVTPFEMVLGECELIRAVTTRTKTGNTPDLTYQSINTIMVIDDCLSTIRNALKLRLRGLKNNAVTRESIRSQVAVELQRKLDAGIIEGYAPPNVYQSTDDPAVCVVELTFEVCHSINQIHISAHITV